MCNTICGADCTECMFNGKCAGCAETSGKPFGGKCLAAQYIKVGGKEQFEAFKKKLLEEINAMQIEGMPQIGELFCLCGSFVNLSYTLPAGNKVCFLDEKNIYLGAQVPCAFDESRCFGVVADMDFILICTYGENGSDPELVLYKKR